MLRLGRRPGREPPGSEYVRSEAAEAVGTAAWRKTTNGKRRAVYLPSGAPGVPLRPRPARGSVTGISKGVLRDAGLAYL